MRFSIPAFPTWLLLGSIGLLPHLASAQTALYVNDASTSGDLYTSAVGSDATGTGTAGAPVATVARALALAGANTQTIYIDAGTYSERVVLSKAISLRGAGNATARPTGSTVFSGGLQPAAVQTTESGLLITVSGGSSSSPLTIAGITFQNYDFGIQATSASPQAYVLVEDVEAVHNRQQGIVWSSLGGVQNLTFRRVRASYTAEGSNTLANGAGRGLFLVNGHKTGILMEDCLFEQNRRAGIDVNDGSVSDLTVRNCQFSQNAGSALVVLGAAGTRTGGSFTGPAALIEGNGIRNNGSCGMELKSCTGSGKASGVGSFVVRNNFIARAIGASTTLVDDNAGIAFIDRDRDVIATGGGVTGDLVTGGAYVQNNIIRGYLSDANASAQNINGFGIVLEGAQNKVFGNVVAQCQRGIQVQDRPTGSTGSTPFFDISRNALVVSSGDSIRSNRLDSCTTAIRVLNLTTPINASLNWLGANTAADVRGAAGTGGLVQTLGGPASSFAEVSSLTPTGLVDYSPFINGRADASLAAGFQPVLTYLNVDAGCPRSTTAGPLAEGITLAPEGSTVHLAAGNYAETATVAKNLTFNTTGTVTLATLRLTGAGKVLTLAAPLTLTGALTLTNGLVRTTATALLTLANMATAGGGNANSYVEGPLCKIGQQAFIFPLGKNGQWARLRITAPASAATAFTAEYVAAAPASLSAGAPLSEVSQVEHWTLTRAGSTDGVKIRLYWENAFRSGIDDFSTDLQVAAYTGSSWQTTGNGGLGGTLSAGYVSSSQTITSFTAFTLGSLSPSVNPLSPQLGSFTATQPTPGVVNLHWTMTNETNAYGYAVERSVNAADTTSWQQIGFVASQAVGAQARTGTYHYQDAALPTAPQAYYRLRQTTPAGDPRYSEVANVALAANPLAAATAATAEFTVYPNPASGQVTLQLPAPASGPVQVTLTDLSGRQVLYQVLRGAPATTLPLPASLAAGIYLLQVQGAGLTGKPQRLAVQ